MPTLHNSRHERFAQLVATGKTPAEAYVAVRYAEKTAYTCGPRLLKTESVRARVIELEQKITEAAVTNAVLNREFVIRELMDNALKAKGNGELSASNRALELLGKEIGMFERKDLPWDGDPATLTDLQLSQLNNYLERIVFGGDPIKIAAAKKQAMLEAGLVVDIESASESTQEPQGAARAASEW